jgi:hypothetical protein
MYYINKGNSSFDAPKYYDEILKGVNRWYICRHYNKGMRMIKAKEGPKAIKLLT